MTSLEKEEPAIKAMAKLEVVWREFKGTHSGTAAAAPDWNAVEKRIDQAIGAARTHMDSHRLHEAHQSLESVRIELMGWRRSNDIPYFVDWLTDFHGPMETIVLTTTNKKNLSSKEEVALEKALVLARQKWDSAMSAPLNETVYGMSPTDQVVLKDRMAAEEKALSALEKAFRDGNKTAVLKLGPAIKKPFSEIFKQFGNFSGLF